MSIEKSVLEKLLKLPVEKQKEVLDFVESLEREAGQCRWRGSPGGLWADLGVDISPEDIADTRREMWGSFPHRSLIL
jgi:hypothetical protein